MKVEKWLFKNTNRLDGKWIAVSGTTGGIGEFLVRYIAYLGGNIVFLNRNIEKTLRQEEKLLKEFPKIKTKVITADMENVDSVFKASELLKEIPLYALIHNAGAYSIKRRITNAGFDNLFQINLVSPYFLTKELLPVISENLGRVILVGSIAHNYSKIDKNDIDFSSKKANSLAYGNAKRYLMFSHYKLFEKEGSATLSVTHPGITFTGITNHYPKLIFALIKHPMKVIFEKPEKASLSVIKGLFDSTEKNSWIGPNFFNIWGLPNKKRLNTCSDAESEFIFKTAEEIYEKLKEVRYGTRVQKP